MILQNINIVGQKGLSHIKINGKIERILTTKTSIEANKEELNIVFNNVIAFPGLINSHDHLEFNLFPKLGNSIYKNYAEWGRDINAQNKNTIADIVKIPKQLRAEWGVYKNLLNGITTVIQHGENFNIENPLINIFQDCYSLHSVRAEKFWKFKLNWPFSKSWPFVIHVGEGTDTSCFEEINSLIKWNFFNRRLIAVHGVSMNILQAKAIEALVWCPDSNFFLFNETAKVKELKKNTKILFGTDSTVSASSSIWQQISLAREIRMLSDEELFNSLTSVPATVWRLDDRGIITEGKNADIVIAKMKDKNDSMNSFFQTNEEDILLVLKNGKIILFDETLKTKISQHIIIKEFDKIFINNVGKFLKGNLIALINKIKKYAPEIRFPIEIEQK